MRKLWPLGLLLLLLLGAFLWRSPRPDSLPGPSTLNEAPFPDYPEDPVIGQKKQKDPISETAPDTSHVSPPKEEERDAVLNAVVWFLKTQNEDGSWGAGSEIVGGRNYTRVGTTAMALLAFLGAGYSHLSKDMYDNLVTGDAVRKAIQYLMKHEESDPLNAALSALALSEAYGLTGSHIFIDQARERVGSIVDLQRGDGSWSADPTVNSWASMALVSAKIAGIESSAEPREKAGAMIRSFLEAYLDPTSASAYILLSRDRNHPELPTVRRVMKSLPPSWDRPDYEYWYWGSLALFRMTGSRRGSVFGSSEPGPTDFDVWQKKLHNTLTQNQKSNGAWSDSVVKNALATMSIEVYYRYASVLK